jgi:hypothetical protein
MARGVDWSETWSQVAQETGAWDVPSPACTEHKVAFESDSQRVWAR